MNGRIFISIASYLDPMLSFTLSDAVAKADHPELLSFGIVDQHFDDQRNVLGAAASRLQYLHVHPRDTLGVSWARHLAYSLYDDETYFLQIDAHTLFDQGWDTTLKTQHTQLQVQSAKPIVTTYPARFEMINGHPQWTPLGDGVVLIIRPMLNAELSAENVLLSFQAYVVAAAQPVLGCHIAAGFHFCSGRFIEEVGYDPYLYFFGEEQSLSARAFTHGWDIYHPTHVPLYHLYRDTGTNPSELHWGSEVDKHRQRDSAYLTKRSDARLKRLLLGDGLHGAYGLGTRRTLDDFRVISGIDYRLKTIRDPYNGKFPGLPRASVPVLEDHDALVNLEA